MVENCLDRGRGAIFMKRQKSGFRNPAIATDIAKSPLPETPEGFRTLPKAHETLRPLVNNARIYGRYQMIEEHLGTILQQNRSCGLLLNVIA